MRTLRIGSFTLLVVTTLSASGWDWGSKPKFVEESSFGKSMDAVMQGRGPVQSYDCPAFAKKDGVEKCFKQQMAEVRSNQFYVTGGKVSRYMASWSLDFVRSPAVPTVVQMTGEDAPKFISKSSTSNNTYIALYFFSGGSTRIDAICPTDGQKLLVAHFKECKMLNMIIHTGTEYKDTIKKNDLPY